MKSLRVVQPGRASHRLAWVRLPLFSSLVLFSTVLGCERSPTVPAAGRLTYRGEPLVGVSVQFVPIAGGRPSTGFTDVDGRFQLRYTKDVIGVVPGRHAVTLDWYPSRDGEVATTGVTTAVKLHGPAGTPMEVVVAQTGQDLELTVE